MIDNQQVGNTIAILRQRMGLSQQGLADLCSVTHQAVSKWENGQALPDMQTMLFLSKLFSVSMEDLLTGQVPAAEEKPREEKAPISPRQEPEASDAPQETDAPREAEEAEGPTWDVHQIMALAPFASRETIDRLIQARLDRGEEFVPGDILGLAPFASQAMVEKMLCDAIDQLDMGMAMGLAPFVSASFLEEIADQLPRSVLPALAPFLPAGKVDELLTSKPDKKKRRMQIDVHLKLGKKRIDKHWGDGAPPQGERMMMRIARKAVEDGNEEWLEEYGEELSEEELKTICLLAADRDLWGALEHLTEHADSETLAALADKALAAGQGDCAVEWAEHMDAPACGALLLKAAEREEWGVAQDLLEYADSASCRDFLELAAARQEWSAAEEALDHVKREDLRQVLENAVARSDWPLIRLISESM
ncbi:MAG: helix-turn-helix transcriptional regulator [Clostridia bacterium]|nr:helix-turn-helix transcriptional regulator [Clostridia bacterium]